MLMKLRPYLSIALLSIASPLLAADLLVGNVNGYTLDSDGTLLRFEAMLIDDGKVLATGSRDEVGKQAGDARVIDGGGRTLLPGLIDAHGHVMGLGLMKRQANLTGTTSLADALGRIRQFADANTDSAWVVGGGWNQVTWKLGRFPTAKELDAALADRPVWLQRVDGHAGWANSAAIARAGIDKDTKDPAGGRIERDAEGQPTGVFIDAAMALVEQKIPPFSAAQNDAALDAALVELARVGLTSVADAGIDTSTFERYKRYADAGKLTARIYAMIGGVDKDFDEISTNGPLIGYGGDFLTVRSVKLYNDGALGSRGAAMLTPYSDAPDNSGLLFYSTAQMTEMIGKAMARGYQVNVHAIGDRGNRVVLDSFAAAYARHGGKALRNRIEHAQVVALEDITRFKELDLIASMQPTHATSDMNMAEDRVGRTRVAGAYAWRRFLDQGTRIAAGSDFPVESANPFFGLHAAVTRQDHAGKPPKGWYPDQRMTMTEALRGFTRDAAYAAHAEKMLGTLEPGKHADFILVDRDIFTVDAARVWSTEVLETWVGGKRVYAR